MKLVTWGLFVAVSAAVGCGGGGASSGGGGGSPSSGGGTGPIADLACASDAVAAAAGRVDLAGPAADFVPLCSGEVLIGDTAANRVLLLDAAAGAARYTWQLADAPAAMVADPATNSVFVGLASATSLVKLDLTTGAGSAIALPAVAEGLADAPGGRILVKVSPPSGAAVLVVDAASGTIAGTIPGSGNGFDSLLAFDAARSELVMAAHGVSPSTLARFSVDFASYTAQEVQLVWTGGNGQEVTVSPDSAHVAFPCGGGNGAGYTIADFSGADLTTTFGAWNTGPYPRSAAFDPASRVLAATDGHSLYIFDVATHAALQTFALDLAGCGEVTKVRISRGGRIALAYAQCGTAGAPTGRLFLETF